MSPVCVLNIGGLDPSSGAGITADIKTCEVCGVYGLGAATAITRQTHDFFAGVTWLNPDEILGQLKLLPDNYNIKAVKIGLVESLQTMEKIVDFLEDRLPDVPIIWDPVLSAASGFTFHSQLNEKDLSALLPRLTLVTPNRAEALELFPELTRESFEELSRSGTSLLIKSWNETDGNLVDLLLDRYGVTEFAHPVITGGEKHGSGCFLSTAIACDLARGENMGSSVKSALDLTARFLATSTGKTGFHSRISHLAQT